MTVMQAGAIAGPLVGGVLIPFVGFSWLYLVDTITLLRHASARWSGCRGCRSTGRHRHPRAALGGRRASPTCATQPVLLMSFVVDLIAMVFGMPRALFPEIAHEGFGGPDEGGLAFALLFAAIPAGAVLGGVFSGWVSRVERAGPWR